MGDERSDADRGGCRVGDHADDSASVAAQVAGESRLGGNNAPMESFFRTLKVELVHQCRWATQAEALFGYIEGYYNRHRMHSAVGHLTPEQAEQRMTG